MTEPTGPAQGRTIGLLAIGYSYEEIGGLTGLRPKQVDRASGALGRPCGLVGMRRNFGVPH